MLRSAFRKLNRGSSAAVAPESDTWSGEFRLLLNGSFDRQYYQGQNPDVDALGVDPLEHYLTSGWREGRNPSKKFDTSFYLRQNPDVASAGINPLVHYLSSGMEEGRAAMPPPGPASESSALDDRARELEKLRARVAELFDEEYYLASYPDVKEWKVDAFEHYHTSGWKEGRNPSELFDTRFYLERNPDVAASGVNPLLHYHSSGRKEGRPTVPAEPDSSELEDLREAVGDLFNEAFYRSMYPDVPLGMDALEHYLISGWKEGRNPSELFDTRFYLEQNPDVAASTLVPLLHYVRSGRSEGRRAQPEEITAGPESVGDGCELQKIRELIGDYFNEEFYLDNYPEAGEEGTDPLEHYLKDGWRDGRNPSRRFNTEFYIGQNPDVAAEEANPLLHYLTSGKEEGRLPLPPVKMADEYAVLEEFFDEDYYLHKYPDIRDGQCDPLEHYVTQGWEEGRDPSPLFDTDFYLEQNLDVRHSGENPLLHYVKDGRREGRYPRHPVPAEVIGLLRQGWDCPPDGHLNAVPEDYQNDLQEPDVLERFRRAFSGGCRRLIISFSHDAYTKQCGGIQAGISREQNIFNDSNSCYLNISPGRTFSNLSQITSASVFPVEATADGVLLGQTSLLQVREAVSKALSEFEGIEVIGILHSLLGHSPELVADFFLSSGTQKSLYFWIHDYSSLCPSYSLMRNNAVFCGAPAPDSQACGICSYGSVRPEHLRRIHGLFNTIPVSVVAPSKSALDFWREKSTFKFDTTTVHHHVTLEVTGAVRRRPPGEEQSSGPRPLKVAFCGYPVMHKGWFVYRDVLDGIRRGDRSFQFYHFSESPSDDYRITWRKVRVSEADNDAMTRALSAEEIDLVLLPALWPETFCHVAYEALAAGCAIVTLAASGNVGALAEKFDQVIVYSDQRELADSFRDGSLYMQVTDLLNKGINVPDLKYTGTTATLELD